MNDTIYTNRGAGSGRKSFRPVLIALTASFLLGGAVIGYGTYRYLDAQAGAQAGAERDPAQAEAAMMAGETPQTAQAAASPTPTPRASATNAARQAAAVERVVDQQGGIDQRLAAAEQRLARLDLQAQAPKGC